MDKLSNPTVKAAFDAWQSGDLNAWLAQFSKNAQLLDDRNPRDLKSFSREIGKERFTRVDRISNDGLEIVGDFHSDTWGDFRSYFRFTVDTLGKISKREILPRRESRSIRGWQVPLFLESEASMRTALFFLSGLLLLGAARLLAHLFSEAAPSATTVLAGLFSLMWLAATGYNMWAGVHHAGYSWTEEAPIFLLLFLVPLAVAWFIGLRP